MFPMSGMGFMGKKDEGLPFIFSVTVTAGQSFTIPTVSAGNYNAKINFGDGGSIKHLTTWNGAERSNTYVSAGTYDITISGVFEGWSVNSYADRLKITEVKQWGVLKVSAQSAFQGCTNITFTATDILDTSSETTFHRWFFGCAAVSSIPNIEQWDTSSVNSMYGVFSNCVNFNQSLNGWDLSSVTTTSEMFQSCTAFNGDITGWNVSNVEIFGSTISTVGRGMFHNCVNFNQDISIWDVSSATNFNGFLAGCTSFSRNLNGWNVSNVVTFSHMFANISTYNQPLSDWDVSSGSDFYRMFLSCTAFNQDLPWTFKTTGSINLSSMFQNCTAFNGDITGWNTGRVTDMSEMFLRASSFNRDISGWDVSNVKYFSNNSAGGYKRGMFYSATAFNQPIGAWDTSSGVLWMDMFGSATAFDQDISNWNIESATKLKYFFRGGSGLSTANYDALLIAWATQSVNSGLLFDGGTSQYTAGGAAEAARNTLITTYGWTITDGGSV